jgi:hypothetical protein
MLLMGDEQDIKHKEAANAAKEAAENNDFILSFPRSPMAPWRDCPYFAESVSHFRLILLIGSGRPRVTNKVRLLTLCYSVGEPRYSQA